jgi:uroporphyrinogen III methyltransferase/synthase
MIQIASPDDIGPLDRAIEALSSYDWLIFTSVNAVDAFFDRLFIKGKDIRSIGHMKTAVIGPATQKKLLKKGITSDIIPKTYRAESVMAAFSKEDIKGKRILLPRAREARPILPVELTKMGARVDEVEAYCTRAVDEYADQLILALEKKRVDLVTFTSSSTAKNFKKLLPENRMSALMEGVAVASIGPITTQTAISLGFDVHVTAENFTIPGLIQTIVRYFNDTL